MLNKGCVFCVFITELNNTYVEYHKSMPFRTVSLLITTPRVLFITHKPYIFVTHSLNKPSKASLPIKLFPLPSNDPPVNNHPQTLLDQSPIRPPKTLPINIHPLLDINLNIPLRRKFLQNFPDPLRDLLLRILLAKHMTHFANLGWHTRPVCKGRISRQHVLRLIRGRCEDVVRGRESQEWAYIWTISSGMLDGISGIRGKQSLPLTFCA